MAPYPRARRVKNLVSCILFRCLVRNKLSEADATIVNWRSRTYLLYKYSWMRPSYVTSRLVGSARDFGMGMIQYVSCKYRSSSL